MVLLLVLLAGVGFVSLAEARKIDLALILLIDDSGRIDDREAMMQLRRRFAVRRWCAGQIVRSRSV